MSGNTALRDKVLEAVEPLLGRYIKNGEDQGSAFWPQPGEESDGDAPSDYRASGLECVVSLWPEDYDDRSEFTDEGVTGVLHYSVVLRAWQGTTWEARKAIVQAFPLLTTRLARRPRHVPRMGDLVETTTLIIPVLTD